MIIFFDRALAILSVDGSGGPRLLPGEGKAGSSLLALNLFQNEDHDRLRAGLRKALAGEAVFAERFMVRSERGDRMMSADFLPGPWSEPAPAGLLVLRDLANGWLISPELREEKALADMIWEMAGVLVVILDREGRIVRLNRTCERLTGLKEDEVRGRLFWEAVVPAQWMETAQGVFIDLVEGAQRFDFRFESPWLDRRGEERLILWHHNLLREPGGRVKYVIGAGMDMTEYRRLEAEMRESQKWEALSSLAAGMAHDFNNILTAIRGRMELLLALGANAENQKEWSGVFENIDRAALLVRQLVDFSAKRKPARERLEINEAIREIVPLLRAVLPGPCRLELDLCPEPCLVEADRLQFQMILGNLARNSQNAMPEGGRFTIRTETGASCQMPMNDGYRAATLDCVRILVSDTGTGMTEEVKARIFEPYFTTKPVTQGSGLGLATAYNYIYQWQGFIGCESRPGAGTVFLIELPRLPGAGESLANGNPKSSERSLPRGRETIMIVDDDAPVRDVLSRMLERLGYKVVAVPSPSAALELFTDQEFLPELFLIDFLLPEMKGPELAARLREARPEAKIIFVSGFVGPEQFPAGIPVLPKPVTLDALAREVRKSLDRARPKK